MDPRNDTSQDELRELPGIREISKLRTALVNFEEAAARRSASVRDPSIHPPRSVAEQTTAEQETSRREVVVDQVVARVTDVLRRARRPVSVKASVPKARSGKESCERRRLLEIVLYEGSGSTDPVEPPEAGVDVLHVSYDAEIRRMISRGAISELVLPVGFLSRRR